MVVHVPQADAKLSTVQSQLLKGMVSIADSSVSKASERALNSAVRSANAETVLKIGLSTYGSAMSPSQKALVELGVLVHSPGSRSLLARGRAGKRFSGAQKAALMRLVTTAADNIGIAELVREGKQLLRSPATLAADVQAQERASSSGPVTVPSTGNGALDRLEVSIVRADTGSAAKTVVKRVTSLLRGSVLSAYVKTMSPLQAASFLLGDTGTEDTNVRLARTHLLVARGAAAASRSAPVSATEQAAIEFELVLAKIAVEQLDDILEDISWKAATGASFLDNLSVGLLQLQGWSRAAAVDAVDRFGTALIGSVGADGIPTGVVTMFGEASLPEIGALLSGATAQLGMAFIGGLAAGSELAEAGLTLYYSSHPLGLKILPNTNVQMTAGQKMTFVVDGLGPNLKELGPEPGATVTMVPNGGPCPAQACTTTMAGPDGVIATMGDVTTSIPVTVLPGPLKFFGLAPTTVTIPLGADTNFAVFGTDAWDNPIDPGAVESATTFSISPGRPDGWCVANTCGATTPGAYTVTATSGAFSQSATLTVTATATATGPLDHLTLLPASASIAAGSSETFTVEGYDAANDDLGPVTDATLSISPDGSCTAYTCTASKAGAHTVTATDGTAQGTATLTVITSYAAPCVFSSGGPPDCQSTDPLVTDEATTQGAADCTLSDNIDWGDKSPVQTVQFTGSGPLETFPIAEHTYSTPGTYSITASVPVAISGPCAGGVGSGDNYQFTLRSSGGSN